ncbi:hypothetical protein SAY86_002192 [Trapa natans]|uniref:Uncharacterized protein n=1 Tax=Trapa natans TaxID=22666 RepID=A0AAN7LCV8_TRANT|nr:hypothetical protein SAY86_002192 [Trapa natans]
MNFLLRSTHPAPSGLPPINKNNAHSSPLLRPVSSLENLVADDPFPQYGDPGEAGSLGRADGLFMGQNSTADVLFLDKHSDVSEEEGWITIPCKKLPFDWNYAPDIHSLRSLDRSFVFPGEQIHMLACLSAYKLESELITPFGVSAAISNNGIRQSPGKDNGDVRHGVDSVPGSVEVHDNQDEDQNRESPSKGASDQEKDNTDDESLLGKEYQKLKTEATLQRFNNSHFFVRIAEFGEKLWSKKGASERSSESSDVDNQTTVMNGVDKTVKDNVCPSAFIDKGNSKASSSGVARDAVQCCALANGDIVVILKINVGVDLLRDPVIEILQFEKYKVRTPLVNHEFAAYANADPYRELLTWLLPLDNSFRPPARSLSPPTWASVSGIGNTSQKSNVSAASGSKVHSFGHVRSYSMSSIPQSTVPASTPTVHSSKSNSMDLEGRDEVTKQKPMMSKNIGKERLLSFRTVSLEPERFSVCCGLEGIYTPGRRWRRKLEIIQPIEIQSFTADCNTNDLLCVRIKNVSPTHVPDIVMYIDAITIVLEEASKGGPPLTFPIASIEAGEDCSLPNLALRRGEEHSFVIRPEISAWNKFSAHRGSAQSSSSEVLHKNTSTFPVSSKNISITDHYAIMVSCHSNYTESRLFFKQTTSWQPRISRDMMVSITSEMSRASPGLNTVVSQLPVQVLTLQASNMTSEDLTMTVLAPASLRSPPSVVSLNSSLMSSFNPLLGITEFNGKSSNSMQMRPATDNEKRNGSNGQNSDSIVEQRSPIYDDILNSDHGFTHLWLQSRVPLGCIPSKTTATIKLELLPLTDGIVTLDTLQIDVKEKGCTYIPEQSLKINATSSLSTGVV